MYGQDAAEDRVVVYLDRRPFFELPVVLRPGDVQRLVALAARAHELGAHPLGDIVFEAEWRYPRRDCMGRDSIYTSSSASVCQRVHSIISSVVVVVPKESREAKWQSKYPLDPVRRSSTIDIDVGESGGDVKELFRFVGTVLEVE